MTTFPEVKISELSFKHFLPAHGSPIRNTAKEQFLATFANHPAASG